MQQLLQQLAQLKQYHTLLSNAVAAAAAAAEV
jgi:hypothetical protein